MASPRDKLSKSQYLSIRFLEGCGEDSSSRPNCREEIIENTVSKRIAACTVGLLRAREVFSSSCLRSHILCLWGNDFTPVLTKDEREGGGEVDLTFLYRKPEHNYAGGKGASKYFDKMSKNIPAGMLHSVYRRKFTLMLVLSISLNATAIPIVSKIAKAMLPKLKKTIPKNLNQ